MPPSTTPDPSQNQWPLVAGRMTASGLLLVPPWMVLSVPPLSGTKELLMSAALVGRVGGVIGSRNVSENMNRSRPSGNRADQVLSAPVQPLPLFP